MKNKFIKKYWDEENLWFYIHFQDEWAVRQLIIGPDRRTYLTEGDPIQGDEILYDQKLEELELEEKDFVSEDEFNAAWNQKEK